MVARSMEAAATLASTQVRPDEVREHFGYVPFQDLCVHLFAVCKRIVVTPWLGVRTGS